MSRRRKISTSGCGCLRTVAGTICAARISSVRQSPLRSSARACPTLRRLAHGGTNLGGGPMGERAGLVPALFSLRRLMGLSYLLLPILAMVMAGYAASYGDFGGYAVAFVFATF